MRKSLLTLIVTSVFAISLQAQKAKTPLSINDPALGLNQMITLQPGKTWVWLGDFFPYVSAIDSVTVPVNYPGVAISKIGRAHV